MKSLILKFMVTLFLTIGLLLNLNCSNEENPVEQTAPPVVAIVIPVDNTNYGTEDTISFSAELNYPENLQLDDSLLVWSSDIDGMIGTGMTITTNSLSVNNHVITLKVTPDNEETDSAQIAISIFITFEKTLGKVDHDAGEFVYETANGDFIITGSTESFGTYSSDVYLIKTDNYGNLIWENSYGGRSDEFGNAICETEDGGFIIIGSTTSSAAEDVYLIKTDSSGTLLWEKTYGGDSVDKGNFISKTSDGGFIITGSTRSFGDGWVEVYLIKIDNIGNVIWEKTYGGANADYGASVKETSDGGFIITGSTISYGAGNYDLYLIKTDNDGTLEWEKFFGGVNGDDGKSVSETSDGDFIVAGTTRSTANSGADVFLLKFSSSGDLLWNKRFERYDSDQGSSVCIASDGGYVITGYTYQSPAQGLDVYLIKTDSNGMLIWEKTFGGVDWDEAHFVSATSDGGFIITGSTTSSGAGGRDVYLIKTDSQGNVF